jgi:hypothetical protein
LAKAVVIQTEVSFIALYKGQPVFGDIDLELRKSGFVPHAFAAINKRMIAPLLSSRIIATGRTIWWRIASIGWPSGVPSRRSREANI